MAESILEQNVVLEIAEIVGSDDINTQVQTGTVTHRVYTGCEDSGTGDIAFNSPYTRTHYKGNEIVTNAYGTYHYTIGDSAYGCTCLLTVCNGLHLYPANWLNKDKLIAIDFSNNGTIANFEYEDNRISRTYNSLKYWDANNSQDKDDNVQGRNLYMEDNTQSPRVTYCFEIFDRDYNQNRLILRGNGTDPADDIQTDCPVLNTSTSGEIDWYVSPYVHSYQWSSRDTGFSWSNINTGKYFSYSGAKDTNSFDINENWIDSGDSKGVLGLRSDDFYYNKSNGNGKERLDCWELKIEVSSINNAEIEIYEGSPTDSAITLNNPENITTAGVYTFCLAALRSAETSHSFINSSGPNSGDIEEGYNPFMNQVNLLCAKAINPGSASVVVQKIELTKKNPGFFVYDEPVYQYSVAYSVDRYNWNYLDVKESEGMPLSLNFSVGDLKDISKRSSGYSKTFMLPANKHNNEVLTPMLAVGAERSMIHWMKARIKVNGLHIFKGLMRVEEGNTGRGGFYKCHIIQDTIGWAQAIEDNTLCDLALVGPGGVVPPEPKSYNSVVNSWDDNADTSDFIYGLVNYGEWQAQSVNPTPTTYDYTHNTKDFHPVVFAKSLVDKIFSSKGYSIQSNFIESDTFKKLCHPWVSGENYLDEDLFNESGSQYVKVKKEARQDAGFHIGGKIPATFGPYSWYPPIVPGSDAGNNWINQSDSSFAGPRGYKAPFTGTYRGTLDAKMYVWQTTFAGNNTSRIWLQLRVNGVLKVFNGGHSQASAFSDISRDPGNTSSFKAQCRVKNYDSGCRDGLTKFLEFEIDLNAGDYVQLCFKGENDSWLHAAWFDVSHVNMKIYPIPSSTIPDQPVNLSKILPCMKQIDYLKGLTEVFNLQWTADEERKIVYCEPYNDFFGSGEIKDWSEKLDYKSWNDKFIIEQLAKEVTFKYKEDTSDKISDQVYRWNENNGNEIEQSHTEFNEEKFRKDVLEMGTDIFSTTIMFNAYGKQPNPNTHGSTHPAAGAYGWGDLTWTDPWSNKNNPLMPAIWNEGSGGHINTQDRPDFNMEKPKFDMRMFNYYGKTDCSSYVFIDSSGNHHNTTEYPHLGYINEWIKGTGQVDEYNLSWSDENDGYDNISPGLFTKYWRVAYLKMNGGAALRTCYLNLTANDIAAFDYRDLILLNIDGVDTYWTVNKISDYKPNSNELTKVELIEWKHASDFAQNKKIVRARKAASPNQTNIISQSQNKGLVLKNNTQNNSIGSGIAFGNGVVAQDNQTVLGNYNQPNNTDILQVGSGLNQKHRATAFTIKNNGEVEIHGGECFVEETDGVIHDLVYTDTDGNIKKLYLKKE